jgi:hypothetical protein
MNSILFIDEYRDFSSLYSHLFASYDKKHVSSCKAIV